MIMNNVMDYFGARYYSSDISVWLSVDQMAHKYPSMSPYMYVGGHPTMVIDPNGMDWIQDKNGNYKHDKDINKDTKLGEGEKYLGKSKEIKVNDSEGNYSHSYNLNEGGSVSDTRGNSYEAGHGQINPGFVSGHTIDNTNSVFTADDLYKYAMNALPVAGTIDATVGSDAGGGSDVTPIGTIAIFQGDDAWTSHAYSALDMGGGLALGVEASIYGTVYWYFGDIGNFSKKSFKGWSNNVDITVGDGLVVGIQMNWVTDKHGGILIGIGPHIGAGLGSPVNITYQKKKTMLHE